MSARWLARRPYIAFLAGSAHGSIWNALQSWHVSAGIASVGVSSAMRDSIDNGTSVNAQPYRMRSFKTVSAPMDASSAFSCWRKFSLNVWSAVSASMDAGSSHGAQLSSNRIFSDVTLQIDGNPMIQLQSASLSSQT